MRISRIQYITQDHIQFSHLQLCQQAIDAGANWIQLRMKNVSDEDYLQEALKCRELTLKFGVKLIINDKVKIAKQVSADGVHLGQDDISVKEARKLLGNKMIIGGTANTFSQVMNHIHDGVDYLGIGPYRFTSTKKQLSPIIGLEGMKEILLNMKLNQVETPFVAIGGIELKDVLGIKDAGIHGVALSGLISNAENKKEVYQQLQEILYDGIIENSREGV